MCGKAMCLERRRGALQWLGAGGELDMRHQKLCRRNEEASGGALVYEPAVITTLCRLRQRDVLLDLYV